MKRKIKDKIIDFLQEETIEKHCLLRVQDRLERHIL